jgi:putative endonuclease
MKQPEEKHFVYILCLENGKYYTGYTVNPEKRFREHIEKRARCKTTQISLPSKMVQCWRVTGSRGEALRVEAYIKTLSRKRKDAIVENPLLLSSMLKKRFDKDFYLNPEDVDLINNKVIADKP